MCIKMFPIVTSFLEQRELSCCLQFVLVPLQNPAPCLGNCNQYIGVCHKVLPCWGKCARWSSSSLLSLLAGDWSTKNEKKILSITFIYICNIITIMIKTWARRRQNCCSTGRSGFETSAAGRVGRRSCWWWWRWWWWWWWWWRRRWWWWWWW